MAEDIAKQADLTNCDREPIHIPGAILPHGVLIVLDPETFEVLQVAGDTKAMLDMDHGDMLGRSLATMLQPSQIEMLRRFINLYDLSKPRHLLDPLLRFIPDQALDVSIHRIDGVLVLEAEIADLTDRFAADPLSGVQEMVKGFDAPGTLQELCQLASDRVRAVVGYDRVLVYRFMQDESGWVIAESREPHLEPFLDLHYPAADIPKQARTLYVKNWFRLIAQVNYTPARLSPQNNPLTGKPLDMSQAILRDVSPIHREYMRNMGLEASMSISIIREGKLWGLIVCHNYSPRILPRHLRAVCELFGSMFSLQLEARDKGEQFEQRLASRMVLQNLILNLATADDYADGLTKQSPNLLDYIVTGSSVADGTSKGGVAVSIRGTLTFLGVTPSKTQIAALVDWMNDNLDRLQQGDGVYSTDRLGEVWLEAVSFASVASGVLFISITDVPSDFIIWFRPELIGITNWAGQHDKIIKSDQYGNHLSPRKSFEVWKETVRGRCLPWAPSDIDAAYDLRISLLNVVLRRIDAMANERKHALERDQLLMAELDHRVKNTIANIQALVRQTSRSAESVTSFVTGLEGRIRSMAKAHSLLSQSRWESVSLTRLIHEELDAYGASGTLLNLNGDDLLLTPKSALSLSLAIHELATNAAKYGSLSISGGSVSIDWQVVESGLDLCWTEVGGPPVSIPSVVGFGTTLIEKALAMETGGKSKIEYVRDGVVCKISLPEAALSKTRAAVRGELDSLPKNHDVLEPLKEDFRILVVEDSFLVVTSIEELFNELGWTILGPASRKDVALKLARFERFDAALLDINLNGEMSWDIAAVLQERGIPFVFSTGYDSSKILPDFLVGSVVLGKPLLEDELARELRKCIGVMRTQAVIT